MSLFDHLVGGRKQCLWNRETECLRGLEIDGEVKLRRKLDWQVRWLGAIEYLPHVTTPETIDLDKIWPIAQQSAGFDKLAPLEGCRQPLAHQLAGQVLVAGRDSRIADDSHFQPAFRK